MYILCICNDKEYLDGFSATAPVVGLTVKPRAVDFDESDVYQELLCFSTTPRNEWFLPKEVQFHSFNNHQLVKSLFSGGVRIIYV